MEVLRRCACLMLRAGDEDAKNNTYDGPKHEGKAGKRVSGDRVVAANESGLSCKVPDDPVYKDQKAKEDYRRS